METQADSKTETKNEEETITKKREKPIQESKSTLINLFNYINTCDKVNLISVLIVFIAVGLITAIGIDECKKCMYRTHIHPKQTDQHKKFWAYGKNMQSGYLKHVFIVLERLGYEQDQETNNWDLFWAHDYPFRTLYNKLNNLKAHQRVNHFPGCGYLTNKVDLATSGLEYIPPAFKLPSDKEKLLEFSERNPKKSFVIKNNDHRNVRVKTISEIDLNANDSFVQEFIDNPLLVSGHMFDIGIYTIVTSIDPLRVYIYNGDALLRFCPEKYQPFDRNNLNKYVVGDDYLPTWEVPALEYYYNELGFGMRDSLNAYLKTKNKDPSTIWLQIEDSIRTVILAKEQLILNVVKRFKSKRNFFEMMRFDFMVDEDLKVSLMEANMSPNLSSAHFKPNQLLYEQVLFNLFGLIGVGERIQKHTLATRSQMEESMQTADKNIAVMANDCSSNYCRNNCDTVKCSLCLPCLSVDFKTDLIRAQKEHLNRGDCKRIFPPEMESEDKLPTNFDKYSHANQLMYKWFHEKCRNDKTWCR